MGRIGQYKIADLLVVPAVLLSKRVVSRKHVHVRYGESLIGTNLLHYEPQLSLNLNWSFDEMKRPNLSAWGLDLLLSERPI